MGTSSMYGGPSSGSSQGNPLLPNDFNEDNSSNDGNENDGKNNDENTEGESSDKNPQQVNNSKVRDSSVTWQTAKSSMSRVASGKSKNIGKAVSNYVKAHGGSKTASKTARSGVITISNIGSFINNVSSNGFTETLESYKIEYQDKSAKDVLNELINYLAPSPITKEDSIARKALIVTMEKLYELLDEGGLNIDNIDSNTFEFIIPKYVESYIYERLINDLGSRLESNSENSKHAIKIEQDIKEYINSKVEIAFKGKDFSTMTYTKKEIESLFNQCYTIMEDML